MATAKKPAAKTATKPVTFAKNRPVNVTARGRNEAGMYVGSETKTNGVWHRVRFADKSSGLYRASQLSR